MTNLVRNEGLEVERRAHVVIAGCVAAVAAAEWLHGNAAGWAWAAGLAAVGTAILAFLPRRPRGIAPASAALACLVLGVVLITGVREVRRIECCWPEVRAGRMPRDSLDLKQALVAAEAVARRLAEQGRTASLLPREATFQELREAVRSGWRPGEIERGVVILDAGGHPVAWAGRHRFIPARDTAELRAVITPFYVSLEARRQTQAGETVVGTVLLDAAPAAPDRDGTVSALFERAHGVALQFYPPDAAPQDTDVFDYCPTGCATGGTLVSVQALPPAQGDTKLEVLRDAAGRGAALLAATLLLLLLAAPPGPWRWVVVLAAAWSLARAPLGPSLQLGELFSPAAFHRPALGVFSSSAGSLALLAVVALCAGASLWRRGFPRRWWSIATAGLLVLGAPYLVRYLGRGIAPPAGGVSVGLWLSWEVAVAAASMAFVFAAAALVRGPEEPRRVPWTLPAACAWAALAGLGGLWLWHPYGAWPEWYTLVWLPALVAVLVPAPRRWAVIGIATVAGSAAALVAWGASVEGRLRLAERDAQGLGGGEDPPVAALLERLGAEPPDPTPRSAGALYAFWIASPLAAEDYPASLDVWTRSGDPIATLRLANVDLPLPLVAGLVRSPTTARGPRVERLERVPGVHYVLVAPLASGEVLTVGVGPLTRLIAADRVAQFLQGEGRLTPPYAIFLSPPSPGPGPAAPSARVIWTRVGWSAHGERRIELPGGLRHVHVRVHLRGPLLLIVRGTLVVALDIALLAAVWLVSLLVAQGWRVRLPRPLTALRTSYRLRLTAALAGFFVVPVLLFALWSFARLGNESRRAGDLLITRTLRDAAATAGALVADRPTSLARGIQELGERLDADLWLYHDGLLAGTSAPVLGELGLVNPMVAPSVFTRLAFEDELELTADGYTAGRPIRVGYRVVQAGPAGQAILAVPQLLDDERVRQQQEDLVLGLVFATLAGLVAAIGLAGLAARGLARPVAALREAAEAVGRGAPVPAFPPGAPREFEPVMSAFERMAADVKESHAALDEARRRTAQVLANVATGVIAVDEGLRVTMANPRAADLLGGGGGARAG